MAHCCTETLLIFLRLTISESIQYHRWLDKVSVNEFADELILAATAEYLKLFIVVVPYTPPGAAGQWAISEHPYKEARQAQNIDETRMIILGNNDVHYVWLCDK